MSLAHRRSFRGIAAPILFAAFRKGTSVLPGACALTLLPALTLSGQEGVAPDQLAKLDGRLRAYLATVQDDQFVPVVFHLQGALVTVPAQRHLVLGQAQGNTPLERRTQGRQLLIAVLEQDFAARAVMLMPALTLVQTRGSARELRPLIVVGGVGCWIQKGALNHLLENSEALQNVGPGGIRLDLPVNAWGASRTQDDCLDDAFAWGVKKIGADNLALTGTGVVVAVIDDGFNLSHPALKGRFWSNPGEVENGVDDPGDANSLADDLHGWNFVGNDGDTTGGPHGTAVAGIVAGNDDGSESGITLRTGVAPGASLMLLRVGSGLDLPTQQRVWAALGYALEEGAQIVNMSLQWGAETTPDEASWRTAIDTLTEAGLLVVTISGNDANQRLDGMGGVFSPPRSVTTPGRVPSSLTVGATNEDDHQWMETDLPPAGSNTGPVTWATVAGFTDYPHPPGLMKPDVVAPGDNLCVPFDSFAGSYYLESSGTSCAAPHAAGLAALLLGNDQSLGPYDLRYILEESALELPAPPVPELVGPDQTFGWGRIDANKAASLPAIPSTHYDLAITATNHLWTTADIWVDNDDDGAEDIPVALTTNHLYARVRNLGGQVVGNVRLDFYYADVSTIGIDGFDPDGDGDPSDGNFFPIGSYTVPLLGPAGSKHDTAIGLVPWDIPTPTSDHWCVGVAALADPPNAPEDSIHNNRAFRNFFDLIIENSGSMMFSLRPPEKRKREPFDFVVQRLKVPSEARLALVVDPSAVPLFVKALHSPGESPGDAKKNLQRFDLDQDVVRFRALKSPDGRPFRVSLSVQLPLEVRLPEDAMVVMSVLDAEDKAVGGLTVRIRRNDSVRRVGPFVPKKQ
jgi:subtilisin family serine protease